MTNYTWTKWNGPDVLMGGGAENFVAPESYKEQNYYDLFAKQGYQVVHDKDQLANASLSERLLGIFCTSNMVGVASRVFRVTCSRCPLFLLPE